MTSKGQITVPKDIRDELKLVPGSKLMFVRVGPGDVRIVARTGKLSDLKGILHRPGQRAMSIEEMNDAIADAAAESGMAGLDADQSDSQLK
ncbi:AbrB/MazE/SpoVT family DNA-binding domain-containing protein [Microlunatus elymi]|uniref:AbrB/MazE/SpoVT family DNA-binding domain-containing protein n=2 Tax=Microlunatus elymi TaxID=2596828 RepID=A0A516Q686_9ACTN|nr:AbrB/MazE/SpoVT family DNA-binding domain-containing protein [Microlunatus elymi]